MFKFFGKQEPFSAASLSKIGRKVFDDIKILNWDHKGKPMYLHYENEKYGVIVSREPNGYLHVVKSTKPEYTKESVTWTYGDPLIIFRFDDEESKFLCNVFHERLNQARRDFKEDELKKAGLL